MDFKNFDDVINFATEKEKEAVLFYEEAAEVQTEQCDDDASDPERARQRAHHGVQFPAALR